MAIVDGISILITNQFLIKKLTDQYHGHNFLRVLVFCGAKVPSGPGPPHYRGFTTTIRHSTLGRTPLN